MEIIFFTSVFVASLVLGYFLIPQLKKLKAAGHYIREDGPKSHYSKRGTPLMGGLIFIITTFIGALIYSIVKIDFTMLYMAVFVVLFGAIGFLDDYIKVVKKGKNGIRAKQKMIMLLIVSVIFSISAYLFGFIDGKLVIPVLGFGYYLNIGIFIIPFAIFILVAATNAVNLTDGVDGLAGTITSIILLVYVVITSLKSDWEYINIFSIIIFAGLLAFLFFNYNPARIFMGDSGSLALGGGIGLIALLTKTSFILPVIGIVYIIETFSVILQVLHYKRTKKRLFKMAPLHHHFELSGFSENIIVLIFSSITVAACYYGLYLLGIRPF